MRDQKVDRHFYHTFKLSNNFYTLKLKKYPKTDRTLYYKETT